MRAAELLRPTELPAARQALGASEDARIIAGGQTLVPSMKLGLVRPTQLVDLARIPGLRGITVTGDRLVVGAMTTHAEVAASSEVLARIPALAELAGGIGDRMVRHMGTIGGSIANNDPAADYPAAVLALDATVVTDRRRIAAAEFFTGMFATSLAGDEIVKAVEFPIGGRGAYAKFRNPASRYAIVGVFVAETASGPRVAVTGAGHCVFRFAAMEAALARSFSVEAAEGVALDATDLASDLHASAAYRAHLVTVMTARAVAAAIARRPADRR
jgi:carbon-monoxide dehydrogenase medium subunit